MTSHAASALAHLDLAERAADGLLADDIRYVATTLALAAGSTSTTAPMTVTTTSAHLRDAADELDRAVEAGELVVGDALTARSEISALILSLDT